MRLKLLFFMVICSMSQQLLNSDPLFNMTSSSQKTTTPTPHPQATTPPDSPTHLPPSQKTATKAVLTDRSKSLSYAVHPSDTTEPECPRPPRGPRRNVSQYPAQRRLGARHGSRWQSIPGGGLATTLPL